MLYTIQYSNDSEVMIFKQNVFSNVIDSIEFSNIDFAKVPTSNESDIQSGTLQNQ